MALPRFEKLTHCPKCDTTEQAEIAHHNDPAVCSKFPDEHMHRTCRVCRHEWPEKPIDAA